jgi:hypothetical protein
METRDTSHEANYPHRKKIWKKKQEVESSINSVLNYEIEKKINVKKD